MNLLIANGHVEARHYPLGMVNDEAALVVERENGRMVSEALLLQSAVGSILSRQARSAFTKKIKSLNVEAKPKQGLFDETE